MESGGKDVGETTNIIVGTKRQGILLSTEYEFNRRNRNFVCKCKE